MSTIDSLEILKNGLPEVDLPPRSIVVVGAGMAGLTAAMLLKEAGHTVTILEAQNRLGGRVFTYYDFPGKMYGEFGAMRLQYGLQHAARKSAHCPGSSRPDQNTSRSTAYLRIRNLP